MNIIAISGKRKSGKSTLAKILKEEYGYQPISLADPLKTICRDEFGLTFEQTDGIFKEQPTQYMDYTESVIGVYLTPRDIMIRLGRFYRTIDPDFWVKKLLWRMQGSTQRFVVSDVRFLNEIKALKDNGAILVRLERDEKFTGRAIDDPSEKELDDYKGWDIKVPAEYNIDIWDLYLTAHQVHNAYIIRH